MERKLLWIIFCCVVVVSGCNQSSSMEQDVIAEFRDYQVTIYDIEQHQLDQVIKEKAKSRLIWYMIYEHAIQQGYPMTDDLNSVVTNYISDHTPSLLVDKEMEHRDAIIDLMSNIYNQYRDEVVWNESYQF